MLENGFESHTNGWWNLTSVPAANYGIPPYEGTRVGKADYSIQKYFLPDINPNIWPGNHALSVAIYLDIESPAYDYSYISSALRSSRGPIVKPVNIVSYVGSPVIFDDYTFEETGWYIIEFKYTDIAGKLRVDRIIRDASSGKPLYMPKTSPYYPISTVRGPSAFSQSAYGQTKPFFIDDFKVFLLPATLFIDDVDTEIADIVYGNMCLSGWMTKYISEAKNHGQFVSKVARLAKKLRKADLITAEESETLVETAAESELH